MSPFIHRIYHWTLWNILSRTWVAVHLKPSYNFRRTPDSDRVPKPPFVIVGNHGTFFDPWFVGYYCYYPLSFMTNDDGFRGKPIVRWYLNSIGAFPKKKGASDYRAMKETLKRLAERKPVCIFPEGQTSWNGETQLIYKGIEKIIKRAACPLVMVHIRGNFLTKPWWAIRKRKGRVLLRFKVLTAEQIRALSDDELFDTMKRYIYQNDMRDESNLAARFSGERLAEGLERYVWQCMHCRSEDTLETKGDRIRCGSCDRSWEIDAYCRLRPLQGDTVCLADLKEWSDSQRANVIRKISTGNGGVLTESRGVMLQTLGDDGYSFVNRCRGRLCLTAERLTFAPEGEGGEPLEFSVADVEDYVVQKKDIFEIRSLQTYHRFVFSGRSPMKWVYYVRYLKGYEEFEKRGYL
jgi:1-acyl-sn-glycerol-3-phosphate acyltransferase